MGKAHSDAQVTLLILEIRRGLAMMRLLAPLLASVLRRVHH